MERKGKGKEVKRERMRISTDEDEDEIVQKKQKKMGRIFFEMWVLCLNSELIQKTRDSLLHRLFYYVGIYLPSSSSPSLLPSLFLIFFPPSQVSNSST